MDECRPPSELTDLAEPLVDESALQTDDKNGGKTLEDDEDEEDD